MRLAGRAGAGLAALALLAGAPARAQAPAAPPPAEPPRLSPPPGPAAPPAPAAPRPAAAARAAERVTFAEAVRRTAQAATSVVVAVAEIRRADALLWQVRSAALPSLGASAAYTRLDSARGPAAAPFIERDAFNASGSLQLPLVSPSRWAAWAHAGEQVEVARAAEADVRRTALVTSARAYLAVLAQRRLVEVSLSAREIAKARYDFAHARRAGGIGNAVDELRAEQQLAAAEAQLTSAQLGLVRAQEALGILAGGDAPLDASDEPAFEPRPGEEPVAAAEALRADLKAARARLDAAEHVARDSWLDWLPTLLATGQVFYNTPATVTSPQTGWQVQFVLSLPIYEGGLRVGQQRERVSLADEARAVLDGSLKQARSDVRLGLEEIARQEASLTASRVAADRARQVLRLTVEAYRAGATNDLDVSTAQQNSRDADLASVIAEDAVRQGRLDLLTALGQFP